MMQGRVTVERETVCVCAWTVDVGNESAVSQGNEEKVYCDFFFLFYKRGVLVLSAACAGSFLSVFKPTGLP